MPVYPLSSFGECRSRYNQEQESLSWCYGFGSSCCEHYLCYDRTYNGSKTIDNKTSEQSREKTRHGMKQSRKDCVSVPREAMDSFPASKLLTDSLQPRNAWMTYMFSEKPEPLVFVELSLWRYLRITTFSDTHAFVNNLDGKYETIEKVAKHTTSQWRPRLRTELPLATRRKRKKRPPRHPNRKRLHLFLQRKGKSRPSRFSLRKSYRRISCIRQSVCLHLFRSR